MIPFVKAHACGNDFLVVQEDLAGIEPRDELSRRLCHRNQGIGADGVEFLLWTGERQGRIHLRNADGSAAEISGNGTRCAAAWMAYETKAGPGDEIYLETDAGLRICRIEERLAQLFHITSSMGVPEIAEGEIIPAGGQRIEGVRVLTGNPHFVIFTDQSDLDQYSWESIGKELSHDTAAFPHQTNVEFVRILARDHIEIRIYERGVGPTRSSGTGTCAAAVAAIALRGVASVLRVDAPGGSQTVKWNGPGTAMHLTGPAELIGFGEAW